jgi:glutamine amidotransferase PdxT
VSARDNAIDELARAMGVERVIAGACVDALVLAAAMEAGVRISESLIEPLSIAVRKHADGELRASTAHARGWPSRLRPPSSTS